jgi:hypothetical protein
MLTSYLIVILKITLVSNKKIKNINMTFKITRSIDRYLNFLPLEVPLTLSAYL